MQQDEVRDWCQYFHFEHSPAYQKIQLRFWEAVDTFDPNSIAVSNTFILIVTAKHTPLFFLSLSLLLLCFLSQAILHAHPYHIDSLLQMSEVSRLGEDIQMASELIGGFDFAMYKYDVYIVCMPLYVWIFRCFFSQRELCIVLSAVSTHSSTIHRLTAALTTPGLKTGNLLHCEYSLALPKSDYCLIT